MVCDKRAGSLRGKRGGREGEEWCCVNLKPKTKPLSLDTVILIKTY